MCSCSATAVISSRVRQVISSISSRVIMSRPPRCCHDPFRVSRAGSGRCDADQGQAIQDPIRCHQRAKSGRAGMVWLFLILHLFIGSTLAGSLVIAALASGYDTLQPILIAAGIGFVAAFPVSWIVSKKLYDLR